MAKKSKNNKKAAAIIIVVLLIIAAVVFLYFKGYIHFGKINETTPQSTISETAGSNEPQNNSENTSVSESSSDTQQANSQTEVSGDNDGEYNPALPLTVNDAFDILKRKYGNDSRINMSSTSGKYHNFTVIKNSELYATIKVNLSTGEAEETIAATEKVNKFNLV